MLNHQDLVTARTIASALYRQTVLIHATRVVMHNDDPEAESRGATKWSLDAIMRKCRDEIEDLQAALRPGQALIISHDRVVVSDSKLGIGTTLWVRT